MIEIAKSITLQKLQQAINNTTENIVASHKITNIEWNPITQQFDVEMRIQPHLPVDRITIGVMVGKDECPICKFEERFKALMDEVE